MKKITITIDGFSSCGKSTLARQLAHKLNYVFIDSGAMYRAITLYFLRNHIDYLKNDDVVEALNNIELDFKYNNETGCSDMYLNDENVEYLIRDMLVAEKVSDIATVKEVRAFAVAEQRKMGKKKGLVMDGRDIGTTVFPKAELKIFMKADPVIRVERRFKEVYKQNPLINIEEIKGNLEMRDYIDSNREFSPLRQAKDAIVIDNSKITMEDQLKMAYKLAKQKITELETEVAK
jgi:cytidylate kinase